MVPIWIKNKKKNIVILASRFLFVSVGLSACKSDFVNFQNRGVYREGKNS